MLNWCRFTLLALLFTQFAIAEELPFDRTAINRYSLDGVPRSISIRQGSAWLGYDLERATVMKVWRARDGEVGLEGSFTVKSVGDVLFEDKSGQSWTLNGDSADVRYLGCSDVEGCFELRWELKRGARTLRLAERVSTKAGDQIWRELKVNGLSEGDLLELPAVAGKAWNMSDKFQNGKWIRITLS